AVNASRTLVAASTTVANIRPLLYPMPRCSLRYCSAASASSLRPATASPNSRMRTGSALNVMGPPTSTRCDDGGHPSNGRQGQRGPSMGTAASGRPFTRDPLRIDPGGLDELLAVAAAHQRTPARWLRAGPERAEDLPLLPVTGHEQPGHVQLPQPLQHR